MSGIAFPGCQVTIATARGSSAPAKTGADFCSLPVWGDSHTGSGAVAPGPSGLTFRPRFVALAAGHMALLETFKYKNFVVWLQRTWHRSLTARVATFRGSMEIQRS